MKTGKTERKLKQRFELVGLGGWLESMHSGERAVRKRKYRRERENL